MVFASNVASPSKVPLAGNMGSVGRVASVGKMYSTSVVVGSVAGVIGNLVGSVTS